VFVGGYDLGFALRLARPSQPHLSDNPMDVRGAWDAQCGGFCYSRSTRMVANQKKKFRSKIDFESQLKRSRNIPIPIDFVAWPYVNSKE